MTANAKRGRLRILQVILSRGFAGSERAVAEACNALSDDHDVAVVVRRDDRSPAARASSTGSTPRSRSSMSRRAGAPAPSCAASFETGSRTSCTRTCAAARATSRSCGRRLPHLATLHLDLNGLQYLRADGMICISDWQLAAVPRNNSRAGYS